MNVRILLVALSFVVVQACGARKVEVRTATAPTPQVAVQVNNNLTQAVNVYVIVAGTETFLRQVPANSNLTIPVQGVTNGSTVGLRAVTLDGVHTYSRNNVVLSGTYAFPLP